MTSLQLFVVSFNSATIPSLILLEPYWDLHACRTAHNGICMKISRKFSWKMPKYVWRDDENVPSHILIVISRSQTFFRDKHIIFDENEKKFVGAELTTKFELDNEIWG